jgi:Zn-dependent M16 (insulinase) family peptidase
MHHALVPLSAPRSVGLKAVDPAKEEAVVKLVMDKLADIRATGFSASAIEAAINTLEFRCVHCDHDCELANQWRLATAHLPVCYGGQPC